MIRCCLLSNAFSASIEIIMWFLSFLLLMWCITLIRQMEIIVCVYAEQTQED